MRDCTVGAPVQSCNLQLLTSTSNKFAAVELLTKENLYFIVEGKSRVKEIYAQTCAHLSNQGMREAELFGLAVICDGEYLFVDPDNKLSKYAPKHWKASNSYGLDCNNRPTFILYFRVQYYVDTCLLLHDDLTRHHYYLQLRHNVLARGLLHASSSREALLLLAGFALQADLGDYDCEQHNGAYFAPHEYIPPEMVDCDVALEQTLPTLHRENRGVGKAQAQLQYITEASSTEASRLTHNSHLYRLKHKKQEPGNGTVHLAICAKGIEIYEENSSKALTATFLWNNIGKLCFDRKKFEIRALNWLTSGDKYTYYTNSDEKSKHLLFLCRVTHQFSMTIQSRLADAKRREDEERQRYRDCYLYSRSLGPGYPSLAKFASISHFKGTDKRISLISNTSSNTTSGIVSDRVQSLDESEDDLELEIMINSPPALSEESLSFAHLRDAKDNFPASIQVTSVKTSGKQSCTTSCVTPAMTEGSQCSSSGSTIVVAPPVPVVEKASRYNATPMASAKRRTSTSSSLELGFSHTAQNSVVSDTPSTCAELDYSAQSAQASSGIFTLRSSNTAESTNTNATSSETSGIAVDSFTDTCSESLNQSGYPVANTSTFANERMYAIPKEVNNEEHVSYTNSPVVNEEETMRERSNSCTGSIVSAWGSFHGDGSDPTDAGPRNLLTAEELSDLIVGNGSSEIASGIYPSRATISSTLDSDSDYVTLPPPPLPPPRTDSDSNYVMLEPADTTNVPKLMFHLEQSPTTPHHVQVCSPNRVQQHYISNQGFVMSPTNHAMPIANLPSVAEEANARFITTKPHINIITAHASLVASTAPKSFAAPTLTYQSLNAGQTLNQYPGNDCHSRVYSSGDSLTHASHLHHSSCSNNTNHLAMTNSYLGYPTSDPGSKMKPGPMSPVIGKNNYLDVHASRNCAYLTRCSYVGQYAPPIPPPTIEHPRQPPPPPPHQNMATVYTSQVTRGQIEQFRQQMYSDVDYVIYPLKDPIISKQEYMDAKQGAMLARGERYQQVIPPPPYPYITTNNLMYRSTPNVASLHNGYMPYTTSNKYASNQNLACDSNYFPGYLAMGSHCSTSTSPLYSASASYSSSSTQSLRFEPLQQQCIPQTRLASSSFFRAKSNVDLLNTYDSPMVTGLMQRQKYKQRPPPPPPPPYETQIAEKVILHPSHSKLQVSTSRSNPEKTNDMLDIRTLREKSKNLDLPLISALCNDRSLLKQTNAFVMPQHPSGKPGNGASQEQRPFSWHVESDSKQQDTRVQLATNSDSSISEAGKCSKPTSTFSRLLLSNNMNAVYNNGSSKVKYPVSGLSSTQMCKPQRRVSASTHTHPHQHNQRVNNIVHVVGRSASSGSAIKTKDAIIP